MNDSYNLFRLKNHTKIPITNQNKQKYTYVFRKEVKQCDNTIDIFIYCNKKNSHYNNKLIKLGLIFEK
jgi:hypothetical protein